jgi:hypothetical protein
MAALAFELLGGMMLADDLYCFGMVKAMSALNAKEMPATRSSTRRRSHKMAAFVTQFGVPGARDAIISAVEVADAAASGFLT